MGAEEEEASRLSWIPQRIKPHKFHGALRGIIGMRPYVRLSTAFYGRLDKRERFPRDFMLSILLPLKPQPYTPPPRVPATVFLSYPPATPRLAGRAIPMDIRSRRYLHDCTPDGLRIADERESIRLTSRRLSRRGVVRKMQFPGRENSSGSHVVATKDLPALYNRLNYTR